MDQDLMKKNLVPLVSTHIWLTYDWNSLLIFMLSFKGLNPIKILRHTMSPHFRTLRFLPVSGLGKCALDYLLASEGGICRKFNLIICCLQIGDERKVIDEFTDQMQKIAHIANQTWTSWGLGKLFGGCLEENCLEDVFQLSGESKSS